ncbi:hypothetical protein K439DRAFT_1612848 [Ramaria rubella]|nr:hypothetical protein K439DRAFT_1612848 [Ramaria rubella]
MSLDAASETSKAHGLKGLSDLTPIPEASASMEIDQEALPLVQPLRKTRAKNTTHPRQWIVSDNEIDTDLDAPSMLKCAPGPNVAAKHARAAIDALGEETDDNIPLTKRSKIFVPSGDTSDLPTGCTTNGDIPADKDQVVPNGPPVAPLGIHFVVPGASCRSNINPGPTLPVPSSLPIPPVAPMMLEPTNMQDSLVRHSSTPSAVPIVTDMPLTSSFVHQCSLPPPVMPNCLTGVQARPHRASDPMAHKKPIQMKSIWLTCEETVRWTTTVMQKLAYNVWRKRVLQTKHQSGFGNLSKKWEQYSFNHLQTLLGTHSLVSCNMWPSWKD